MSSKIVNYFPRSRMPVFRCVRPVSPLKIRFGAHSESRAVTKPFETAPHSYFGAVAKQFETAHTQTVLSLIGSMLCEQFETAQKVCNRSSPELLQNIPPILAGF